MQNRIKQLIQAKVAKLLDHLYFQETKSTVNLMIVVIFGIQKINLLLMSGEQPNIREKDIYFKVCKQLLFWVTFQTPLEILNSEDVNRMVTLFYTVIQLGIFIIFCFPCYKWQVISRIFSFYISNFQLLILNHFQIHLLTRDYQFSSKLLFAIPIYINYIIIIYCSRNFFIVSQEHMLRRYSYFNYILIATDFFQFVLFDLFPHSIRKYSLLFLYTIYFIDSFFYKPYCTKVNIIYTFTNSILVVSAFVKIFLGSLQAFDQLYVFFILAPLVSAVFSKLQLLRQQKQNSIFSVELIIYLGEMIDKSQKNLIEGKICENQIKTFIPHQSLNAESVLLLLQNYEKILVNSDLQTNNYSIYQKKEELQLYITFLSFSIKESYLQCLLQTKKFQLENKNHSLFFKVISNLISQKYDQQVQNFGKTEPIQVRKNHQKLIFTREFQLFYSNHIQEVTDLLDEKIQIWNKMLQGFNHIDEALHQVSKLYDSMQRLSKKYISIENLAKVQKNQHSLREVNILTLRYFSFYYSYIENDFLSASFIEKQIEQSLNQERDKIISNTINTALLKGKLLIISASILENPGSIIQKNLKELDLFFGMEMQLQKIQSINLLMPAFLEQNHNGFVQSFISKGVSDLYNRSKLVFGQDGDGFILPLELSFLHINEKTNDFVLTAILKKISPNYEYILFEESGNVIGISRQIYYMLTEKSSTAYGQPLRSYDSKVDNIIFDCYVQFWIPSIKQIIRNTQIKTRERNNKQILDLYIIQELSIYQDTLIPEIRKLGKDVSEEEVTLKILQFFTDYCNTEILQKITVEMNIGEVILPNNQKFYSLEFQSLWDDKVSLPSLELFDGLYSQTNLMNQTQYKFSDYNFQSKRGTEFQSNPFLTNSNKKKFEINNDSYVINFSECDNVKDINLSLKTKKMNFQAASQSSKQSNNSNLIIYEVIKQISQSSHFNKYVIQIFIIFLILQITLMIFSVVILKVFSDFSNSLQNNIQLARYPDQFNRLYYTFTTMGQLDLERSLLGFDQDNYLNYRIKELSENLREIMENMMFKLRIQFSILDEQQKLPNLNVSLMNYFSYRHEEIGTIEFNLLAESVSESLSKKIIATLKYQGKDQNQILSEYYQLQFLKANLNNQISSSQRLIDQTIIEINGANITFYYQLQNLLIIQLSLILSTSILITQLWKKSYQSIKLMLQLITFSSDEYIHNCIDRAKHGKQLIKSHHWKQLEYFKIYFSSQDKFSANNLGLPKKVKAKYKKKIGLRINQQQFQFKYAYSKICIMMILFISVVLANYFFLIETSSSSWPEVNLTLEYVQFKQDWDSIMILSYLLKTNSVLTPKVQELGFFNQNKQMQNLNKEFDFIYQEMLLKFSQTIRQASSINEQIYQNIVKSNRMLPSDKNKLFTLYQSDLCLLLQKQLPFCSFENDKFQFFPNYPIPLAFNNNREIFKNGINGIFQKVLEIFQSHYDLELHDLPNTNEENKKIFIRSQDFQQYVVQYFFDINKAVFEFYQTILISIDNILQLNFQNTLFFYLMVTFCAFAFQTIILLYFLINLEYLTRASKSTLSLLPYECFYETKCLMIIKQFKREK